MAMLYRIDQVLDSSERSAIDNCDDDGDACARPRANLVAAPLSAAEAVNSPD
jgi:hypothetical protein